MLQPKQSFHLFLPTFVNFNFQNNSVLQKYVFIMQHYLEDEKLIVYRITFMRHFFLMICISKPSDTIFQNQEKSFVMSGERIYPKHHIHQINQFCQDFSHNIKKSRNSFEKWNPTIPYKISHKKWKHIVWDQWLQVANWDEKTNFRLIHHKITTSHLRPGFSEKMRNHFAEDVLTIIS